MTGLSTDDAEPVTISALEAAPRERGVRAAAEPWTTTFPPTTAASSET